MAESNSAPGTSPSPENPSSEAAASDGQAPANDIIVNDDGVSALFSNDVSLSIQVVAISAAEKLGANDVFDGQASGNLDQYLTFSWDGVQTKVGVTGHGGGMQQEIVLQGIDLTSIGDSAGAIISALFTDSYKAL